ncbi:universal stress protein [Hydrogenophaga sp. ZJX-1]|uniref:universal stress protein n=1 Tax=Hydrogenophaga sp. ZJX-1 TaxID=3404778 RepID=UPI003B27FD0E
MLKFLIAVDGSVHAKNAIEAVAALARASAQLEVILVNVRSDPIYYAELPPDALQELEAAVLTQQARVLQEAAALARASGLTVSATRDPSGAEATEIVRAAEELGVDQIVMGTRGMGAIGGLFMGSVAQRVVHLAKRPVLLVK